ncbi:MAG: hypothetical protein R2795_00585 [Saprospiraceae bacterium]
MMNLLLIAPTLQPNTLVGLAARHEDTISQPAVQAQNHTALRWHGRDGKRFYSTG